MQYAEVLFETGSKSIMSFEDEDELKGFLSEHHRRAVEGEAGGPTGQPAERVKKVLLYDNHPGDNDNTMVNASNISTLVSGMSKKGELDGYQLMAAIRDEMSPVYPVDQGKHESFYKTSDNGELDLSFLEGDKA